MCLLHLLSLVGTLIISRSQVAHPDQITEIFDTISYAKGASVLRMLEQFMGEELFREGVHVFLERWVEEYAYQRVYVSPRFKYDNAVTNDLWTALAEVAEGRLDIKGIMDTWTRQMGYPVLQVVTPNTSFEYISMSGGKIWTVFVSCETAEVPHRQPVGRSRSQFSLQLQVHNRSLIQPYLN